MTTPPPTTAYLPASEQACRPAPDSPQSLPPFGDYEQLESADKGGMGLIYRAWNGRLKRWEAVKFILPEQVAGEEARARFRFEAEAAAALHHPHIVPVHGTGEVNGQPYLAMRWVDGGNLSRQLDQFPSAPRKAALLVEKVARAVHHAHQRGILHRDLKPANILIDQDGAPQITDFGLARRLEAEAGLSIEGTIVGTPEYMAPEQARGEKALTVATDIYGLGALLYTLITGRPPFAGSCLEVLQQVIVSPPASPRALNAQVDAALELVCLHCLEKDPNDRYPSAEALADDLGRHLRGELVSVQPPGVWDWLRQALRTRPPPSSTYAWPSVAWHALIILVIHATIFGLARTSQSMKGVWIVLGCGWACFTLVLWCYNARRFRWLSQTERHSVMIAMGHTLASIVLALAVLPWSAPAREALDYYPGLASISGLALFVLGSTHWSRFFLIGMLMFALAPVLAWWPEAAPLIYGGTAAAALGSWAYSIAFTFRDQMSRSGGDNQEPSRSIPMRPE